MSAPSVPCPSVRSLPALLMCCMALAALLALPASAHAGEARWQWPVPAPHPVLRAFEEPEHPYGPGHRGIDIGVTGEGAQVRAVEAGTVRFSGTVAGRGVVSVTHADGLLSTYEPVSGTVEVGTAVLAGEVLGTLEQRSELAHCAEETCLHLGARRGGDYLDPQLLLGLRGPSVLLPWDGPGERAPRTGAARPGPSAPGEAVRAPAPGAAAGSAAPEASALPRSHPMRPGRGALIALVG